MISFKHRNVLDVEKYDNCIRDSLQSRMFGFSWYLDIACPNWGAIVLDDYRAVMPVPWRKKYTINYVYPPLWILELGIFSYEKTDEQPFIDALNKKFKFVELRLNSDNHFNEEASRVRKQWQWISLAQDHSEILEGYRKDRKKDLKKAKDAGLNAIWKENTSGLVSLFKDNIGKRDKNIQTEDYARLTRLLEACLSKGVGELLSVYDALNNLVASAFFLKHQNTVTILLSSTDLKNRNNGANTFLIDNAIKKYQGDFEAFNFGGSSIPTVADYFKSFGAKTEDYAFIKYNRLPALVRLIRK